MIVKSEEMTSEALCMEMASRLAGLHYRVLKLESLLHHQASSEVIRQTLAQMEHDSKVYVERHPRLRGGVLRTDIESEDVVYFGTFPSIQRKTLLYQTRVEYGDYTINHILGCAHGCRYPCYAMQMSVRYGRVADYSDWMQPRLVGNAMTLLEKELARINNDIGFVHLSFMTDPFMHDAVNNRTFPWVKDLTLQIMKRLNRDGIKVTVLTKGLLPEALQDMRLTGENEYGITLVSLDSSFHKTYEPFSAPPSKRLEALRACNRTGLKTWVSLEPYPTPNICKQSLEDLLEEFSFVDKMVFGKWNYNPDVNGHSGAIDFYRRCSETVTEFCQDHDITLHIKKGTPMSSLKSNDLFHEA